MRFLNRISSFTQYKHKLYFLNLNRYNSSNNDGNNDGSNKDNKPVNRKIQIKTRFTELNKKAVFIGKKQNDDDFLSSLKTKVLLKEQTRLDSQINENEKITKSKNDDDFIVNIKSKLSTKDKSNIVNPIQYEKQEQAAAKVANLIDPKNPQKSFDELMAPIRETSKKPRIADVEREKKAEGVLEIAKLLGEKMQNKDSSSEKSTYEQQMELDLKKERLEMFLNKIEVDRNRPTRSQTIEATKRKPRFEEEYERNQGREQRQAPTDENVHINLYGEESLNIFTNSDFKPLENQPEESKIWQAYRLDQLKRISSIVPSANAFEEAIKLTDEGKLWKFPINNEQDITDDDYHSPYYEHVLLDHYLEEFPNVDVIQNFMQLVLTGLSANAFLTVKEKQETIDWYKNYFEKNLDDIIEAKMIENMN